MLAVTITDASLRYGDEWVFENLNLTLEASKWTCLLGRSGAGKSSLLRLIAGLLDDDADAISQINLSTSDGQPVTGRIAWMAQQDLLLPWLKVLDNIILGARLRGTGQVTAQLTAQAMKLLQRVGLEGFEARYPESLSGGQRQRVALARTLLEDKPLVLMDEPFSSLDAITRYKLQELAAELLHDRTILLITHDPAEAVRMGHQVMVFGRNELGVPLVPPGEPLRALDDPTLLPLQAGLLEELLEAVH